MTDSDTFLGPSRPTQKPRRRKYRNRKQQHDSKDSAHARQRLWRTTFVANTVDNGDRGGTAENIGGAPPQCSTIRKTQSLHQAGAQFSLNPKLTHEDSRRLTKTTHEHSLTHSRTLTHSLTHEHSHSRTPRSPTPRHSHSHSLSHFHSLSGTQPAIDPPSLSAHEK